MKINVKCKSYQENSNDELVKLMPALKPADIAAAVTFAISAKENVEVIISFAAYHFSVF